MTQADMTRGRHRASQVSRQRHSVTRLMQRVLNDLKGGVRMSYDLKCHRLAEQFLEDTTVDQQQIPKLAQLIQDTIEDFITEHENE